MPLNIHIATLGHDPSKNRVNKGPIVHGTFRNYPNIGKLYLLCSHIGDQDEVREDLKNVKNLEIHARQVDIDDFSDIISKIIEIHTEEKRSRSDVRFFVNVTGGTKIMTCGALVGANYIGAQAYYVSERNEEAIELTLPIIPPQNLVPTQRKIVQLVAEKTWNQTRIAEKLALSPQTVSYNCDKLEKYGYLSITPDTRDKRKKDISITPMGKMALKSFRK